MGKRSRRPGRRNRHERACGESMRLVVRDQLGRILFDEFGPAVPPEQIPELLAMLQDELHAAELHDVQIEDVQLHRIGADGEPLCGTCLGPIDRKH
jgi:hypothetical protein